ncbi:hypothetical protein ASD15_26900 [Massilia sp. Root351]|jgi:hypothetical protein|uniref:FecR family protein n=1 Tax=Massilia sp. Root351 TaxID=1736522 RepID=UPI00070EDD31|nr:FecR family protein [Massilia sp. Root351]KQV88708.1 hypothetical protein ASD15_26900 [Massilia sp. Root351]
MLRASFIMLGLSCGLLAAAPSAFAAEAGKVVFVTGSAQLAGRAAALDAAVQEGDELSTGADGYVYVKTIDSGFLILRPNSKARIAAYKVDANNPGNTRVKLELLNGVARSISGDAVKKARQNFRFNTPVAAIGVRGTDFIVYTDQETSRVAVVSGGVVMSGFAGACGPEGGGPCEGDASRELFAGQAGALLQVRRGENVPQLLRSPALSPDQNAPPRGDEPVGKVAAPLPAVVELNLDAKKATNPLLRPPSTENVLPPPVKQDEGNTVVDNGGVAPTTPVDQPRVPTIAWGRYQALAGLAPDPAVKAELNDKKYAGSSAIGSYVIKRLANQEYVMPREGTASFVLQGGEAFLTAGALTEKAKVDSGSLHLDFAQSAFTTSLALSGDKLKTNITAFGDITQKGELSNSLLSPTTVRGYVGGAKQDEAAYIFKSIGVGMTAEGGVSWKR